MLSSQQVSEIHRLRQQQEWSERRIARHLGISRNTVSQYLSQSGDPASARAQSLARRSSKLDPFKPLIDEWLAADGSVSARVVLQKLQRTVAGFDCGYTLVKDYLQSRRPRRTPRAYARMEPLAGERFEADWAHFDSLDYGGEKRKLYAFCMVECHSRLLYAEFTHSQSLEAFLRCHIHAFRFFQGVAGEIWYDNLASAVAERDGNLIRFNPRLYAFAKLYRFTPRACHLAAGWEKGKVERAIGYLRQNFWPLRVFSGLADANGQLRQWLEETANQRKHAETRDTPRDRFRPDCLRPLPDIDADYRDIASPLVHKDLRLWFDGNRYCAPPSAVGRRITVKADESAVTLYQQERELACYPRCWSRAQTIGADRFRHAILAQLPAVAKSAAQQRLVQLIGGGIEDYLRGIADSGARSLHRQIQELLVLARDFGPAEVAAAIDRALEAKAFGADYVGNILRQSLAPRALQPPLTLKQRSLLELVPDPLSLTAYDELLLPSAQSDSTATEDSPHER
jgi:transposase